MSRFTRHFQQVVGSPAVVRAVGEAFFFLGGFRRSSRSEPPPPDGKILVIKLDAVGDFVLATPFLRELRGSFPRASITLIVRPSVLNLAETCPYVNEVRAFQCNHIVGKFLWLRRHWAALRYARQWLWPRRFDLAICPRWSADRDHAAFLCYFSGAPRRVGASEFVNAQKREANRGYDRFFTELVEGSGAMHEVERNAQILRAAGGRTRDDRCELWVTAEDHRRAEELLAALPARGESPLVALGLGASMLRKVWPASSFARLASELRRRTGARFILIGGPGEEHLGATFCRDFPDPGVIDAIGKLTLRETFALLRHCDLHIGNDSGPMHLAAAAGKSVVEILPHSASGAADADGSPQRFAPWRVDQLILRPASATPPCEQECLADEPHCILSVGVEQVLDAALALIGENRKSRLVKPVAPISLECS